MLLVSSSRYIHSLHFWLSMS